MQQVDDALQKEEDERVKYSALVDRFVQDVPWRHQMRDELRGMEDGGPNAQNEENAQCFATRHGLFSEYKK